MNVVASDKEYLDWFYHTVRHANSGTPDFERKMADLFKSERGLLCPFYIPKTKEIECSE